MSTPEGKVKDKAKALLKAYGAYWHCPVQNGMGAPGLDFWVCLRGRFCGIETKDLGKDPTPRQRLTINHVRAAGGMIFVIDGGPRRSTKWEEIFVDSYNDLEIWLRQP